MPFTASNAALAFCAPVIIVRFFHSFLPTFFRIDNILSYCLDFGVHYRIAKLDGTGNTLDNQLVGNPNANKLTGRVRQ